MVPGGPGLSVVDNRVGRTGVHLSVDIGNPARIISAMDRYGFRQLLGFLDNKFSSRLDGKVPGVYPKAKVVEGRRALCRQNHGAERPLVIAGERLECPRLKGLPGSSGDKRDGASIALLALPCR